MLVFTHGLVGRDQLVASTFEIFDNILLASRQAEVLRRRAVACAIFLRQFGINQVELVDKVVVGYPAVFGLVCSAHWTDLTLRLLAATLVSKAVHLRIDARRQATHEHGQHARMQLRPEHFHLLREGGLGEEHILLLRLLHLCLALALRVGPWPLGCLCVLR